MAPYITVDSCDNNSSDHQEPVGKRHVDLAVEFLGGVDHLYVWEVRHA